MQKEYWKQLLNMVNYASRSSWFFFPLVKFSENKTFSFQGNEKIVGLLVQNRVDVNKADFLGETPLQLAAYKGESNYFSWMKSKKFVNIDGNRP